MDFNHYPTNELVAMRDKIDDLIQQRVNEDFHNRIVDICEKLEYLRKEYPWVSYPIGIVCENCECSQDFDLFELIEKFDPENFSF